jgi:hypothetical protein
MFAAKTRISVPVPSNTLAVSGSVVTLPCGVDSDPYYSIAWRWYHNSSLVTSVREPASVTVDDNGNLRLSAVTRADIGVFTCEVDSLGGQDSSSGWLYVIGRCIDFARLLFRFSCFIFQAKTSCL